jgi:imidazolonepropionase-like amidohydrolase/Tol biopolymer transport system component
LTAIFWELVVHIPFPAFIAALLLVIGSLVCRESMATDTPETSPNSNPSDKPKWNVNQPPGKPLTITLDTRTGTWMSVDVSPDGKEVLFDLLGDLYVLPIEGGTAKPLTHTIAWDMQARFSPDGKQIAYLSDAGGGDNVWVMNRDGSNAREISREPYRLMNNPVWHPSGRYLAARKHYTGTRSAGSGEIWLFHLNGAAEGGGVQMNEKPNWQKDLGEPAFSPDGRYLYYSQDTTPGNTFEYNKNSNGQIYVIQQRDLKRGKTRVFVSGPGGAVRPTPSPDGQWLAFVRRVRTQSTLFIKNLKTGEEIPVWGRLDRDLQEAWAMHGVYPAFAWTPDAKAIVIWAEGKLWRVAPFETGGASAQEIPFRVQHTREVREPQRVKHAVGADTFAVHQLRWANVAPDGDRVIYSALGRLYIKPLAGDSQAQPLTQQKTHFEFFPRYSRDGRKLVYTTWNDQSLGSVRVRDIATGAETIVTRAPGKYLQPQFSPDGRSVTYFKQRGGFLTSPWHGLDEGIYVVAADGSTAPRLITEDGASPQYGKDNDAIYVTRVAVTNEVDRSATLVRIALAEADEQVVARGDQTSDFALSPNGEWLAFRERYRTYVMPMPLAGRPITIGPKAKALPVKGLDVNAGDALHWSADSGTLHFTLGNQLFSRDVGVLMATPASGAPSKAAALSEEGRHIGFEAKANHPQALIAIAGAQIVSMRGDEVIADGRIIVQGNRIKAIGSSQTVSIPAGAFIVDARGKTIIPGLVDVHWHGGMGENGIIPQQSWINYASLAFGVTTLHDPSNDTAMIFTQAEMQRAGVVVGPRIYSTGTILYGAKAPVTAEVNSLADALTHLKRMRAAGATTVKSYNQPRRDQRQQVLEAARQTHMMVMPEGGSLFQHNMTMIVDGHTGVEHAIPVARAYDDVKQLWAQTRAGYTPTFAVAYGGLDGEHYWYSRSEVWKHPLLMRYVPRSVIWARSVRRPTAPEEDFNVLQVAKTAVELLRAGVPVHIGAHGQREGLAAHWEMWTLGKGGATPLEAIRAATLDGARYIGVEQDLGSLEVGKLADLVIIDGNPLLNIETSDRVTHVMQNGRLFESATMNEIGPTPKARQKFFFEHHQHRPGVPHLAGALPVSAQGFHEGCGCQ